MNSLHRKLLIRTALFVSLIAVSAQIVIPLGVVPLTMQSLAIQIAVLLLPKPYGLLCIMAYLGLGALGFPVFSQGRGGLSHFLGPTGGYLAGFFLASIPLQMLQSQLTQGSWIFCRLTAALSMHTLLLLACGHLWMLHVMALPPEKVTAITVGLILPSCIKIGLGTLMLLRILRRGVGL